MRSECLEWTVRAATDELAPEDFAQNVRWFCEDLGYFLGIHETAPIIFNNANWFRLDACYVAEVTATLERHAYTLRNIFEVYAAATGVGKDAAEREDLMNYEEWALLWDELGFTRELTERKIGTAFAQSRMTVIDEHSKSGKSVQLERLPFEGFLEAFCRLADLKALPTEAEMEAKGHTFAGEYLNELRNEGMECYRGWAVETKRLHEEGMSDPIWQRVDHFVMIIVYVMQNGVEASQKGGSDGTLRYATDVKLSTREVNIYHRAPRPNLLGSTEAEGNALEFMSTEKASRERATRRFLEGTANANASDESHG